MNTREAKEILPLYRGTNRRLGYPNKLCANDRSAFHATGRALVSLFNAHTFSSP